MDEVERFRRLARSSPWLWRSARFGFDDGSGPVRAWVRRPQALRVESRAGEVLEATAGRPVPGGVGLYGPGLEAGAPAAPIWWTDPRAPAPVRDAEGLVVGPVGLPLTVVVDDAIWHDYRWVAMLNPRELADGRDGGPAVQVDALDEGLRHGRATVWAKVQPLDGYDPRCSCCPLLLSRPAALAEGWPDPRGPFAEAHRVALDVGTGICVSAREVGGPHPGRGFDVVIDAVDEVFDDELFAGMGRGGLGARRGPPRLWRRVRPRPGRAPDTEDGPGR